MTPSDLIDELSARMWQPELADRWRARSLPTPAMTALLVLAFKTDVEMSGLVGFLENTTGELLPETIAAFETIGASKTAQSLRSVEGVMTKHGITRPQLRNDLAGERARQMTALGRLEKKLYLRDPTVEPVARLLEAYVSRHHDELLELLERTPSTPGPTDEQIEKLTSIFASMREK